MENKQKANLYLISGLVILVIMVIIIVQNTKEVDFVLLFWTVRAPLIIMFLVMFLFGFFYGQIRSFFSNRSIQKEIKEKDKLIKQLTQGEKNTQSDKPRSSGNSTDDEVRKPS